MPNSIGVALGFSVIFFTSISILIKTPVCDLLGINYPIVLGGMASATSVPMVVSVSEAGGLGILGITGLNHKQIHEQISSIKAETDKPFGVNYLLFKIDDDVYSETIKERPPIISLAWARPDQDLKMFFKKAHDAGSLVVYMVGNVNEAIRAAEAGADVIVAQGTEGGGHVRLISTMALTPMVVNAVSPCPVLAAGGIADGRGLAASLALGAEGVLIGTRFLATHEAPLHQNYKDAIVKSNGHDTVLTNIPDLISKSDWPGGCARALQNDFINYWSERKELISQNADEISEASLKARKEGNIDKTSLLVGQNAGLIDSVMSIKDVITQMVEQAEEIISKRLTKFVV
ncbi:MAG: NAD(P)H-dependent flavin oxidoreductase [Candidatus Anammoxibacter sp.]